MMFLQIWHVCSRCVQSFIIMHYTQQSLFFKKSTSVHRILLSTFAFLMHKQYKSPEWKKRWFFNENLRLLDPIAENEIYSRFNSFVQSKTAIYISHRLSSCVSIPSPCLITQGWWKAARIQRFWLPTANMQRCGTRRQSIMCSLQQHNNAAPGENEKMKEKAKKQRFYWHPSKNVIWYTQSALVL